MAKKKTQRAASPKAAVASRAKADDGISANLVGALILLATATSIVPAFAEGSRDVGRSLAVLLVASAWLIVWASGWLAFSKHQRLWLAGLAAVSLSVVVSSLVSRFPLPELLGGLGTEMGAVQWIALVVICAGVSAVKLGRGTRSWISAAYLWVVPVALFGLGQAAIGKPVSGGFLNDDLFALVLLVWLAPAIGLAITSRRRWERWSWLGVAAGLFVAIFASKARAASGGAVVEAGLVIAMIVPAVLPQPRMLLRAIGFSLSGIVSAGMVALFVTGVAGWSFGDRLVAIFGSNLQTRFLIYQGASRAFAQAPLLGAGPDGYQYAAQRFIQPSLMAIEHGTSFVDATPTDPHSIVMRALVGIGVVGVAALGVAIAGWFVAIRRTVPPTSEAAALRDSFVIAVAGFVVAALFSPWPLTIGASPAVAIGLAASAAGPGDRLRSMPRAAAWAIAVALSAVFVWVGVAGAVRYGYFTEAVASSSPQVRIAALDRSVAVAPWIESSRFQALWVRGVVLEQGSGDVGAFQRAIDGDALVSGYAPLLAEFARQSLSQAKATGRKDLSWERRTLDRAAALAPGIPEVAAERLHLALVGGDRAQIASALAAARGVAEPDPDYPAYAAEAEQLAPAP